MSRIKRGAERIKRRKNILKQAKGYNWGRKSKIKLAKVAIKKAGVYAYRDRKINKRNARGLWQININAGARQLGLSYSKFIDSLKKTNINLDRKILATLADKHPQIFKQIVVKVSSTK